MSIVEKLGITPGPWRFSKTGQIVDKTGYFQCLVHSDDNRNIDSALIAAAPEMIEALIEEWFYLDALLGSIADKMSTYVYNTALMRQQKISDIIEKSTGKSWEEIKELL